MSNTELTRWLKDAQKGVLSMDQLEQLNVSKVVSRLSALYPHKFLDRSRNDFSEMGFAESHEVQEEKAKHKGKHVAGARQSHTYAHCIFLTTDSGALTGVTLMSQIHCSPSKDGTFEVVSSSGVSLAKTPDGWVVTLLDEKSVSLKATMMVGRGWLFEAK